MGRRGWNLPSVQLIGIDQIDERITVLVNGIEIVCVPADTNIGAQVVSRITNGSTVPKSYDVAACLCAGAIFSGKALELGVYRGVT